MMGGYVIALDGVPGWAIADAATNWMQGRWPIDGEPPNFTFAPSPPVLRQLADHAALKHHRALTGLHACRMINAKPAPEPEPEYARAEFVDKIMNETGYGKRVMAIKNHKDFIAQYGFEPVGKTARSYVETKAKGYKP